jgi:hypothetical protein
MGTLRAHRKLALIRFMEHAPGHDRRAKMDQIWFEEDLAAAPAALAQAMKSLHGNDVAGKVQLESSARALIRFLKPRWAELDRDKMPLLTSGSDSRYVLIRLGFEFDHPAKNSRTRSKFVFARCFCHLWPASDGTALPTVYEVIPKDLYEGEPQIMQVKISPTVGIGPVNIGVGELSTSVTVGHVEPAVVGWIGEDGRAPYWELRPNSRAIIGTRYLWMIVEVPNGCMSFDISASAEVEIETPYARGILIGPKNREWASRLRTTIGRISRLT